MIIAIKEFLAENEAMVEKRKKEIQSVKDSLEYL